MPRRSKTVLSALFLLAGMSAGWMAHTSWTSAVKGDVVRDELPIKNASAPSERGMVPSGRTVPTSPVSVLTSSLPGTAATSASRMTMISGGQAEVAAGWALIQRRDYQGAIRAFGQAKAASPENPRLFLGLALSYYRLAEYDSALANVTLALTLDPALEQAHTLLGDLGFMRDDLDGAVRHYESALRLDPNDLSIQDGLYRVRRAQQLEAGFARIVTPHFVVKCEEARRTSLHGLAERLEALVRRIGQQLPYEPDSETIVILYPDHRFHELTDSPSWAGGLFDGKIHLAAHRVFTASAEADAALAHEYVHALVHRLSGGYAPTWLDEGLALYFEGGPPRKSETLIGGDGREPDLIPLHALHGSFLSLPPRDAAMAYAESLSATRDLIDRFGWSRVTRMLQTLAKADDFSVAFETVLQEPYRTFEAAWAAAQSHRSL